LHRYLDIEDSDEPYLDGIKYHAMPPLKRFRDMEHLSGGEKTMAALALLFAVHSYQPSPFFVLDEVDAALDNTNVARIANYIRDHAAPGMQFIVISLKTGLFQLSEALVGIYRDQTENSSNSLTLDVSTFHSMQYIMKLLLTCETAPQIPIDTSNCKTFGYFHFDSECGVTSLTP
jgi:structural maintenance of chromosome 1